jgi:hypothetical protein
MKKWKLAVLVVSQAALTYAVFIICIHEPKTRYQQVEEAVGDARSILHNKEAKINSIVFNHFEHPTTVTIERVIKDPKPNPGKTGMDLLSAEDREFLEDVANGK